MRFELFDGNYIDENLTNYSNAVLFKLKFSGPTFNASLCLHINHYNFHVTITSSRKTPICYQRAINFLFVVKGFTSEAMRGIHFFRHHFPNHEQIFVWDNTEREIPHEIHAELNFLTWFGQRSSDRISPTTHSTFPTKIILAICKTNQTFHYRRRIE